MAQPHEWTVHDLKVMGLNPGQVKHGACGQFVYVRLEPKIYTSKKINCFLLPFDMDFFWQQ